MLSRLSDKTFVSHLMETSAYLAGRLDQLTKWFPDLVCPYVRGRGLIAGLELRRDGDAGRLVELARERGVLILTAGKNCVRFVPSLNITQDEISQGMEVIESCLTLMGKVAV